MPKPRLISLAALGLILSACATGGDLQTMQADLNEARRIAHENRTTIRRMQDDLAIASSRPGPDARGETEGESSQVITTVRESQAEAGLRMEELAREIRTLQGQVDEIEYRLEQAVRDLNEQKELALIRIGALEERVRLLAPGVAPAPPAARPSPSASVPVPVPLPPATQPPAAPGDTATPLAVYSQGREAYKSRDFGTARQTFQSFLEKFPNHEYAGNAQFWIGESYYSEKDYENAILAYEDVLRKHKNSPKVASAMLKQGYAFAAIGDEKTARIILDRVEKKFPGTREAELAGSKLKSLRRDRD